MNITPDQQKHVITEFSALEEKLDQVLFARRDDDEDDFPYVKAGLATAGAAGLGYGGLKAHARGAHINSVPAIPGVMGPVQGDFFSNLKTGAKGYGKDIIESPAARNLRALLKIGLKKTAKVV